MLPPWGYASSPESSFRNTFWEKVFLLWRIFFQPTGISASIPCWAVYRMKYLPLRNTGALSVSSLASSPQYSVFIWFPANTRNASATLNYLQQLWQQKAPEELIYNVICTLFTGQPVRRVFLCVIVMSLN